MQFILQVCALDQYDSGYHPHGEWSTWGSQLRTKFNRRCNTNGLCPDAHTLTVKPSKLPWLLWAASSNLREFPLTCTPLACRTTWHTLYPQS